LEILSEREPEIVIGTDENAFVGFCFTGPVTVIGSPVSSSGFRVAIKGGTALATAHDQAWSCRRGGKWKPRPAEQSA
jgi:hypothetical protein